MHTPTQTGTRLPTAPTRPASRPTAADVLRAVLTVNAITSIGGGAAALVAGGAIAELIGAAGVGWVRLVGAGLLLFGLDVLLLARSPARTRARWAPLVSAVDAAWVAGTIGAIAAGWFSTRGNWMMGAVGVVVLDLAIAQVWSARRSAR